MITDNKQSMCDYFGLSSEDPYKDALSKFAIELSDVDRLASRVDPKQLAEDLQTILFIGDKDILGRTSLAGGSRAGMATEETDSNTPPLEGVPSVLGKINSLLASNKRSSKIVSEAVSEATKKDGNDYTSNKLPENLFTSFNKMSYRNIPGAEQLIEALYQETGDLTSTRLSDVNKKIYEVFLNLFSEETQAPLFTAFAEAPLSRGYTSQNTNARLGDVADNKELSKGSFRDIGYLPYGVTGGEGVFNIERRGETLKLNHEFQFKVNYNGPKKDSYFRPGTGQHKRIDKANCINFLQAVFTQFYTELILPSLKGTFVNSKGNTLASELDIEIEDLVSVFEKVNKVITEAVSIVISRLVAPQTALEDIIKLALMSSAIVRTNTLDQLPGDGWYKGPCDTRLTDLLCSHLYDCDLKLSSDHLELLTKLVACPVDSVKLGKHTFPKIKDIEASQTALGGRLDHELLDEIGKMQRSIILPGIGNTSTSKTIYPINDYLVKDMHRVMSYNDVKPTAHLVARFLVGEDISKELAEEAHKDANSISDDINHLFNRLLQKKVQDRGLPEGSPVVDVMQTFIKYLAVDVCAFAVNTLVQAAAHLLPILLPKITLAPNTIGFEKSLGRASLKQISVLGLSPELAHRVFMSTIPRYRNVNVAFPYTQVTISTVNEVYRALDTIQGMLGNVKGSVSEKLRNMPILALRDQPNYLRFSNASDVIEPDVGVRKCLEGHFRDVFDSLCDSYYIITGRRPMSDEELDATYESFLDAYRLVPAGNHPKLADTVLTFQEYMASPGLERRHVSHYGGILDVYSVQYKRTRHTRERAIRGVPLCFNHALYDSLRRDNVAEIPSVLRPYKAVEHYIDAYNRTNRDSNGIQPWGSGTEWVRAFEAMPTSYEEVGYSSSFTVSTTSGAILYANDCETVYSSAMVVRIVREDMPTELIRNTKGHFFPCHAVTKGLDVFLPRKQPMALLADHASPYIEQLYGALSTAIYGRRIKLGTASSAVDGSPRQLREPVDCLKTLPDNIYAIRIPITTSNVRLEIHPNNPYVSEKSTTVNDTTSAWEVLSATNNIEIALSNYNSAVEGITVSRDNQLRQVFGDHIAVLAETSCIDKYICYNFAWQRNGRPKDTLTKADRAVSGDMMPRILAQMLDRCTEKHSLIKIERPDTEQEKHKMKDLMLVDSLDEHISKAVHTNLNRQIAMKMSSLRDYKRHYTDIYLRAMDELSAIRKTRASMQAKKSDELRRQLFSLHKQGTILGATYLADRDELVIGLPSTYIWIGPMIFKIGRTLLGIKNISSCFGKPEEYIEISDYVKVYPDRLLRERYTAAGVDLRTVITPSMAEPRNDRAAPHLKDTNHCYGNMSPVIRNALSKGDLPLLIMTYKSFIATTNLNDPFGITIRTWPWVPATIRNLVNMGVLLSGPEHKRHVVFAEDDEGGIAIKTERVPMDISTLSEAAAKRYAELYRMGVSEVSPEAPSDIKSIFSSGATLKKGSVAHNVIMEASVNADLEYNDIMNIGLKVGLYEPIDINRDLKFRRRDCQRFLGLI